MRYSDPDRARAAAARLSWAGVPGRPGNLVALLEFGRGDVTASSGFERTSLLAGFTSDATTLELALDGIQAVPGGGTPLYRSGLEVIAWIDTTTPRTYQRTLVVITDGAPSDGAVADELYDASVTRGVRVFAVGLGRVAESEPRSEAALALRELAARTGGIYSAADPPEELEAVLLALALSASPERLLARLRVSPIPPRGTTVSGTVAMTGARGNVSAAWSFLAP